MRDLWCSIFPAATVVCVVALLSAARTSADAGRDFSAFYSLGPAQAEGDHVRLTLALWLSNHTSQVIPGARVRVAECGVERREMGASLPTDLSNDVPTRLGVELLLPLAEYDSWQQGCGPRIEVSYTDAEGWERRTPVESAEGPVPEGE